MDESEEWLRQSRSKRKRRKKKRKSKRKHKRDKIPFDDGLFDENEDDGDFRSSLLDYKALQS